jgi:hypothetical protein
MAAAHPSSAPSWPACLPLPARPQVNEAIVVVGGLHNGWQTRKVTCRIYSRELAAAEESTIQHQAAFMRSSHLPFPVHSSQQCSGSTEVGRHLWIMDSNIQKEANICNLKYSEVPKAKFNCMAEYCMVNALVLFTRFWSTLPGPSKSAITCLHLHGSTS